jgi:hypothetical protein
MKLVTTATTYYTATLELMVTHASHPTLVFVCNNSTALMFHTREGRIGPLQEHTNKL